MAKEKARYFTFLLYPESIPQDWQTKLESLGVPIAISPLHNQDKSNVEGQLYKKAHYHVIYIAKNPVTADSVRNKIKRALGDKSVAKVQIVVQSVENMYLYLTHDSKDAVAKNKHKYQKADITLLNNFDIDRYITLDAEDKDDLLNVILKFIKDYQLVNMFDLIDAVNAHGNDLGLPSMNVINSIIKTNSGIIRLYFDGAYQRIKSGRVVDKVTGEISDVVAKKED